MSSGARTVATPALRTIRVAIAIVPSVRARRRRNGLRRARLICCRLPISTSSSRCRPRSPRRLSQQGERLRPAVPLAAETLLTIAADPRHLGARIGVTAVLHSWGPEMNYHPHVHMIVPGGGVSLDGTRWVRCNRVFSYRCACCRGCSGGCSWGVCGGSRGRRARVLLRPPGPAAPRRLRRISRTAQAQELGRLRQTSVRRPAKRFLPILPAIPIASPSPTVGSLRSTNAASPSGTRITAATARPTSNGHPGDSHRRS